MQLHGKTAFITGAGQGLGRAAALHLSRLGVKVALNGRDKGRLRDPSEVAKLVAGLAE